MKFSVLLLCVLLSGCGPAPDVAEAVDDHEDDHALLSATVFGEHVLAFAEYEPFALGEQAHVLVT